jgi:hypothetical protein
MSKSDSALRSCPKCGDAMVPGKFVTQGHEDRPQNLQLMWMDVSGNVSPTVPITLRVETFRCQRCGIIEQYAKK